MKKIILFSAFLCALSTISAQTNCTLKASVDSIVHVRCYGGADGAIYLKIIGGMSPYTYRLGGNVIPPNLFGLPTGNYSITVMDAAGCRDSILNIKINQDTPKIAITTTPATNGINGKATVTITKKSSVFSIDFINLKLGNNTVSLRDREGCNYTITVTISGTTAVNDLNTEGLEKFDILQNTTHNATVLIAFNEQKEFSLNVFSINGQLIYNQSFNEKELSLNIKDLPSGLLLFSLRINDKVISKKAFGY